MKYIKEIITITTTLTRNPEHTPTHFSWLVHGQNLLPCNNGS